MNIENYKVLTSFIGKFLGKSGQVILFDVKKQEIICVENQLDEIIKSGDKIKNIEKKFIEEEKHIGNDYIINYRALTSKNRKLRSATLFIKDDAGDLMGMLTINQMIDDYVEMRDKLNDLINGEFFSHEENISYKEDYYETYENPIDDLMNNIVTDVVSEYGISPDRLSAAEKLEITKKIDKKGVFLIKGSVNLVSKVLNTSEVSIYRYLNK